jgi:hypothetical protein
MRVIASHLVEGCSVQVRVTARDDRGAGNANHVYHIEYPTGDNTAACDIINFQNGPVAEVGVNGGTNEALIAVVIDRLQGFQSGAFACRENAIALTKLQEALMWLQQRTRDRLVRGVEGKTEK